MADTRLKIAVFIDFDNIEIGVKSTLGVQFDVGVVLEALKERGDVVSKIAYGDWTRAGDYSRSLTQHATKLVQRNLTPGGDKNGADINLALDALEMAFTHGHINAYVIVGGDSDFITLVEKLKQYDKQIFVVGGRAFTSMVMQRNCHEFIAYENLVGGRRSSSQDRGRPSASMGQAGIEQAVPLVRRALKVLADREVSPQLGLLKSTLLQLDSTFSERTYGVGSFRDFAQKLASAGHVTLKESGRNVLVELAEGNGGASAPEEAPRPAAPSPAQPHHGRRESDHRRREHTEAPAVEAEAPEPVMEPRTADGIREVRRLFQTAQNPPRWPMYIRQAKQFLRNVDASFDERKFGFASLVDLLRACQREGLFRIERDRQGVMRLFPGNIMQPLEGDDFDVQPEAAEVTEPGSDQAGVEEAAPGELPLEPSEPTSTGMPHDADVVEADVVQEIAAASPVVDGEQATDDEQPQDAPQPGQPAKGHGRGRGRGAKGGDGRAARGAKKGVRKTSGSKPRSSRSRIKKDQTPSE